MAGKKKSAPLKKIWLITREYEGLAGAGGVKDMCRQLAESLAQTRRTVSVILPCYGFMNPEALGFTEIDAFDVVMNYPGQGRREAVIIHHAGIRGVQIYLVDSPRYREKESIYTYTRAEAARYNQHQGAAYFDYFAMNVLLQKAALALMVRQGETVDVIHCQDGHTALLPAMLRESEGFRHFFRHTGAVVTIHNAGEGYHQEVADLPFAAAICDLPDHFIRANLLNNAFDPFLAAARHAILNTVSENYARELQETDSDLLTGWLGHRLLDIGVDLAGVTNGINPADFAPRRPEKLGLDAAFDPESGDLAGKKICKATLVAEIAANRISGIERSGSLVADPKIPLFTMIGRLTSQKGVDILIHALELLLDRDPGFQVLILGSGSRELENSLVQLAAMPEHSGRICILRGYDPILANRIYAAGDFFLVPSRYEPCGLTDFIAQLAGNIPIVRHTGGLVKVEDGVTGLAYRDHSPHALARTMERALDLYRNQPGRIAEIQKAATKKIRSTYTWARVRTRYLALYQAAIAMTES